MRQWAWWWWCVGDACACVHVHARVYIYVFRRGWCGVLCVCVRVTLFTRPRIHCLRAACIYCTLTGFTLTSSRLHTCTSASLRYSIAPTIRVCACVRARRVCVCRCVCVCVCVCEPCMVTSPVTRDVGGSCGGNVVNDTTARWPSLLRSHIAE